MRDDIPSITEAINDAMKDGILVFASASNVGANYPISFPARLKRVFCIGSADGLGFQSAFSPPFAGEEKYSTLGEGVSGAGTRNLSSEPGYDPISQTIRRDGTSTATPIAVGIAALLIDYTRQFMDYDVSETHEIMRKLFITMSEATVGKDYRYLAPSYLFGAGRTAKERIKDVLSIPAGIVSSLLKLA